MMTTSALSACPVFDVASMLYGPPSMEAAPIVRGSLVLRVTHSELTLKMLRETPAGRLYFGSPTWTETQIRDAFGAGDYPLRIPIPGSAGMPFTRQLTLLGSREEVAPATLIAAALLCYKACYGRDLLDDGWTRCAEVPKPGYHTVLTFIDDELAVYEAEDSRCFPSVGLSSLALDSAA